MVMQSASLGAFTGAAERPGLRAYAVTAAIVLAIFLVRLGLDPILEDRSPLILFTIAVVMAAARFGTGPGLAAIAAATLVGVPAFIEPRGSLWIERLDAWTNVAAFWVTSLCVLIVTRQLASARAEAATGARALGQSEAELRRSRDLLRSVIDGALDPIFVKDRTGAYVVANQRTAEIFGTDPESLRGRRDAELLPPEVARPIEALDAQVMSDGQARVVEELVPEDGTARVFLSAKVPWRDADGRVIGLIGVSRDITDRKAAEASLAASEARLRLGAEAAGLGIYEWNMAADRHAWSPETYRIYGLPSDVALTSERVLSLIHPEHREQVDRDMAAAFAGSDAIDNEYRIVRGDGAVRHVANRARVIREEGRVVGLLGAVQDVTARRMAEAEVRQLNATLEERVAERTAALAEVNDELEAFTYTVSHDLRAPLRAMEGFARILLDDYADRFDEDGRRYAGRIVAAAERMEGLIDDLLTYSRLTRAEVTLRPVALEEVVRAAVPEALASAVTVTLPEDLPPVLAEPSVLRQVLANLVANAAKFQPPGQPPKIQVDALVTDGRVRVTVADNGIGVSSEHQERIFRVFERLHGQEAYPGTGIGLAIVRKGIERMGGAVGLRSTLGRGSEFWFDLSASPARSKR